ncbi:DUF222 domain-containing protein, partial [Arthrobacter sp. MSA 4-2]|uniref:DUF222 domain-containing protein n=1 Tax=Arthrobacter sp. MSA 4-2 TaxID=2794349 RepID=UPI0018E818AA
MATAPIEEHAGTGDFFSGTGEFPSGAGEFLFDVHAGLTAFAADFSGRFLLLGRREVADTVARIEELSRIVDHLQVLGAHAADQHRLAHLGEDHRPAPGEGHWIVPGEGHRAAPGAGPDDAGGARSEFRDTAEYLRGRLRISRSEANRRLRLAAAILPPVPAGGLEAPAPLEVLGAACGAGRVSGRAASLIRDAIERMRPVAGSPGLDAMGRHLTEQAVQSDEDILRAVARRWESVLDQDGHEPSEKLLRARQGVFLRGRRNGLHFLEIGATDEQFEHLATVMNTATNPRLPSPDGGLDGDAGASGGDQAVQDPAANGQDTEGQDREDQRTEGRGRTDGGADPASGEDPPDAHRERPTRAQQLLEGLVGACRIALAGDGLPAAGGHRPQVMVTIDYRTLTGQLD